MSLYPLYGLSNGMNGLAGLPSVVSLQHHHTQQQSQQQPPLLLSAQQAQQLFDASSALSAAASGGSSMSASSSLSALASASSSNGVQFPTAHPHHMFSPLQMQAAGMWPHMTNFLPVSINLAQHSHMQPYGAAQPLPIHPPQQHPHPQHVQQQQHTYHTQPAQSQHQSSSALSNAVASSVFPLPPAPLMPVAHPALPAAATPIHSQSQPLPSAHKTGSDSEKRRRGDDEDNSDKLSKKKSKGGRRLSSAPTFASTTQSRAVSPIAQPASLTPSTSVHSIFASPQHASAIPQSMPVSRSTQSPSSAPASLPLTSSATPGGLPLSNNALLQLSNLTLTGSLGTSPPPAALPPVTTSQSAQYVQPASDISHSASAFTSTATPKRLSASRVDHDSISRTSSNDSGSDSEDEGESSSKRKTRKKHIVTDRQRRARIKEGMTHLRGLLLEHGSFTTDQVSIMMASVQLIHKLKEERAAVEREKEMLAAQLEQMKQYTALFLAQHAAAAADTSMTTNATLGTDSLPAATAAPMLPSLMPLALKQAADGSIPCPTDSSPRSLNSSSPIKSEDATLSHATVAPVVTVTV